LFAFEGSTASSYKKEEISRSSKRGKLALTTSEMPFHKQRVIKIVGEFVYLKIAKLARK
jgi:hypothetical protein